MQDTEHANIEITLYQVINEMQWVGGFPDISEQLIKDFRNQWRKNTITNGVPSKSVGQRERSAFPPRRSQRLKKQ